MARYLVIVEAPTKVKTIKKFLGSNYVVMASNGHVRDLPKSQMGVDLEHDFEPKYITIRGKGEILAGLRKEVKKADKIYLATDPDREGEAISWHLKELLNLPDDGKLEMLVVPKVSRRTFFRLVGEYAKGRYRQHPDLITAVEGTEFTITAPQPLVAVVDGEVLREQRYHIRLSDKKVNFFYPQGLSYQPRMEEAN